MRFDLRALLFVGVLSLTAACAQPTTSPASPAPAAAPTTPLPTATATAMPAPSPTATAAPQAQAPGPGAPRGERVEGAVKAVAGEQVTLEDGKSFKLGANARIIRRVTIQPTDLQAGQYVAITAKIQPDALLLASIVNIFAPEMGNVAPGQRPMPDGNLMTNATIEKVDGSKFVATFPAGNANVQLAPNADLGRLQIVPLADLKAGMKLSALVADGVAQFVNLQ